MKGAAWGPMEEMQQISYGGQATAMAGRERFWLVDELAAEDPGADVGVVAVRVRL